MLQRNYNCLNFKQKVTCFINFDLNFTVFFFNVRFQMSETSHILPYDVLLWNTLRSIM